MMNMASKLVLSNRLKDLKCVIPVVSRCYSGGFHFPRDDRSDLLDAVEPKEKETHTGQKWDKSDYRLVRFVENPKQINERFAIDLIDEIPPKAVKDRVTWCDGGGGPLGHPKVYINLDQEGNHACGYCGLRFYLDHDGEH